MEQREEVCPAVHADQHCFYGKRSDSSAPRRHVDSVGPAPKDNPYRLSDLQAAIIVQPLSDWAVVGRLGT
jgi:hypothetical protein